MRLAQSSYALQVKLFEHSLSLLVEFSTMFIVYLQARTRRPMTAHEWPLRQVTEPVFRHV